MSVFRDIFLLLLFDAFPTTLFYRFNCFHVNFRENTNQYTVFLLHRHRYSAALFFSISLLMSLLLSFCISFVSLFLFSSIHSYFHWECTENTHRTIRTHNYIQFGILMRIFSSSFFVLFWKRLTSSLIACTIATFALLC